MQCGSAAIANAHCAVHERLLVLALDRDRVNAAAPCRFQDRLTVGAVRLAATAVRLDMMGRHLGSWRIASVHFVRAESIPIIEAVRQKFPNVSMRSRSPRFEYLDAGGACGLTWVHYCRARVVVTQTARHSEQVKLTGELILTLGAGGVAA